jgi:hypothetical protein
MNIQKHLKALPIDTIKDIIRKHDELYYIKLGQKKPQLIDALVNHYNQATATHLIPKPAKELRYVKQEVLNKKGKITKKDKPVDKPVEKPAKIPKKKTEDRIELRPPEITGDTVQDALNFFHLNRNYSLGELKKVYKKLSKILHPDKNTGNDAQFKQLGKYYKILIEYKEDDEFFSAEEE